MVFVHYDSLIYFFHSGIAAITKAKDIVQKQLDPNAKLINLEMRTFSLACVIFGDVFVQRVDLNH